MRRCASFLVLRMVSSIANFILLFIANRRHGKLSQVGAPPSPQLNIFLVFGTCLPTALQEFGVFPSNGLHPVLSSDLDRSHHLGDFLLHARRGSRWCGPIRAVRCVPRRLKAGGSSAEGELDWDRAPEEHGDPKLQRCRANYSWLQDALVILR